ncbi:helix-turn-helix transcriptional regulator [Desulfogranum marinum]|uniref:helix-turn-helix domain-containing protein n=1 Tax=Desulfogranum marinum TaxID=453220 RepID=UPI0029C8EB23|nr:helix-turn-helix transcriptional regulator [Desulfogranum marinum]
MKNLRLKARIIEQHGAQFRFSGKLGVNESTVSQVINGKHHLPPDEKKRWAKKLQCQVSDIFPQ